MRVGSNTQTVRRVPKTQRGTERALQTDENNLDLFLATPPVSSLATCNFPPGDPAPDASELKLVDTGFESKEPEHFDLDAADLHVQEEDLTCTPNSSCATSRRDSFTVFDLASDDEGGNL